jgi:beta-galactosidase
VHRLYRALWDAGVTVDMVQPGTDLSGYRVVVVAALSLISDADAEVISRYVRAGGTAVITFFSGIVDEQDRVRLGGYPGAFRELLGVSTDEFFPLEAEQTVILDNGSTASIWTERTRLRGAEAVARYTDGPLSGFPAVTRHVADKGTAWYLGTTLEPSALRELVLRVTDEAGVTAHPELGDAGVEFIRRRSADHDYVFAINHGNADVSIELHGHELLHDAPVDGTVTVPAGEVRVIRVSLPVSRHDEEGAKS